MDGYQHEHEPQQQQYQLTYHCFVLGGLIITTEVTTTTTVIVIVLTAAISLNEPTASWIRWIDNDNNAANTNNNSNSGNNKNSRNNNNIDEPTTICVLLGRLTMAKAATTTIAFAIV